MMFIVGRLSSVKEYLEQEYLTLLEVQRLTNPAEVRELMTTHPGCRLILMDWFAAVLSQAQVQDLLHNGIRVERVRETATRPWIAVPVPIKLPRPVWE